MNCIELLKNIFSEDIQRYILSYLNYLEIIRLNFENKDIEDKILSYLDYLEIIRLKLEKKKIEDKILSFLKLHPKMTHDGNGKKIWKIYDCLKNNFIYLEDRHLIFESKEIITDSIDKTREIFTFRDTSNNNLFKYMIYIKDNGFYAYIDITDLEKNKDFYPVILEKYNNSGKLKSLPYSFRLYK